MSATHFGSRAPGSVVRMSFTTHAAAGGNVAPSSAFEAADVRIYKDGSATQRSSAAGITVTSAFDSIVGGHHVDIDLADDTDAGFYEDGSSYEVWLVPDETIDGEAVSQIIGYFDINTPITLQQMIDGFWDEMRSAHKVAGSFGEVNQFPGGAVVTDGSNSATTFKTDLGDTDDDHWKDAWCMFLTGDLEGQTKRVSGYNGTTKFLTVSGGYTGTPGATDTFALVNR